MRDAVGRVLAEDVRSPIEHPPWDNSSMDGYAVRAADVAAALAGFARSAARAGDRSRRPAPDARARAGDRHPCHDRRADSAGRGHRDSRRGHRRRRGAASRFATRATSRRNVRPAVRTCASATSRSSAGTPIGAAQIGVLASVGAAMVPVYPSAARRRAGVRRRARGRRSIRRGARAAIASSRRTATR